MFNKILIANRGEIAVRIIRACKEMNISTVVVYSEIDRTAQHVRLADEAYSIGPAPSTESYLVMDTIIQTALKAGVQAIHPGYGFLAENPQFPQKVQQAGLVFIGPTAETIRLLGDKMAARQRMIAAGVPVVPGLEQQVANPTEAKQFAEKIGYPVLIKAAAGGGGKGMRIVRAANEMEKSLRMAQSEAKSAFSDDRVYIEKYLERPRHIEIQILADSLGNIVHLGERECSVQRRHQKVIEESPSPIVDSKMRKQMGDTAVKAAKAAQYVNAGTVEFLVDVHKNFYFLEVNTRLQVEHPVTEMVTGIDLVKQQIRIAAGEPLSFDQQNINWRGAAIECRIYAEDPENNFLPADHEVDILFTITSTETGTFLFDEYSWAGYFKDAAVGERAAFGHSEVNDGVEITFMDETDEEAESSITPADDRKSIGDTSEDDGMGCFVTALFLLSEPDKRGIQK